MTALGISPLLKTSQSGSLPTPDSRQTTSLTLARNGRSTYGIVVLPGAATAAHHGAIELQHYIESMTGATLPIVLPTDADKGNLPSTVSPGHLITIASSTEPPLAEEAFTIRTIGQTLAITGGGLRGALYGCYALLDDVCGVRWFTSSVTKIPRYSTLTVGPLDIEGRPAFQYRDPYWREAFQGDWAVRNRCNGTRDELSAAVGGRVEYGLFVHSFFTLVPPSAYFATHSEYFSMIDGRRVPDQGLCLSNPDVVAAAVDTLQRLIPQQPDATFWSVSQNDKPGSYCRCAPCQAIAAEEQSQAGPLIRFVNAVAEAIEPKYPNILVDTLAYQWSMIPPRRTRPRANVRIRFVTSASCIAHGLDQCEKNAQIYQHLNDWTKLTNQMYIWHYGADFINYLQPLPNFDEIAHDVPLFARMGIIGVLYEGDDGLGGGGDLSELKVYLLARLMWDPNRDAGAIIAEFLHEVYGEGAPFLKEWIDQLQMQVRKTPDHDARHASYVDPPTAPYLTDALLETGTSLFDAAERATASNAAALTAIQKARLSLECVQLLRSSPGTPERTRLLATVLEKINRFQIKTIGEGRPISRLQQMLQR